MTKDETARTEKASKNRWTVELDAEKCSLCEVCARRCSTGAIRLERTDDRIALYLVPGRCNSCNGEKTCEAICPEEAIAVVEFEESAKKDDDVLLIESELIRCSYCHEAYSPNKKLEKLGKKGLGHEVNKSLCPLCRRTNMVVRLIDEKIVPEGHAEYRSTKDIKRRARFKRWEDYKKES